MYDWFSFLRICLYCGIYRPPIDILCANCWRKYKEESILQQLDTSLNYEFPVKRVWVWGYRNNHLIKKIIYNLKGGHSIKVFDRLSLLLLQKVSFNYYQDRKIVFVSAPSREPKNNHALHFAKSLSRITGCEYIDVLVAGKSHKKQKRLKRKERSNKVFDLKPDLILNKKDQIIFVDDVITTGSTARAAFNALGRPINFEVWVLAEKLDFNQSQDKRLSFLG